MQRIDFCQDAAGDAVDRRPTASNAPSDSSPPSAGPGDDDDDVVPIGDPDMDDDEDEDEDDEEDDEGDTMWAAAGGRAGIR